MRKKIMAGNWKMHGSRESVPDLLGTLKNHLPAHLSTEVVVFPPYVYLAEVQEILQGSLIKFGAQNMSEHEQGAYTGEISGAMLKAFGCCYVLLGHSERRTLYYESDILIERKFLAAQKGGLIPIVCVGETETQREAEQTEAVIAEQLAFLLKPENQIYLANTVVAYEPVWAIGTGKTATPEQAQAVHAFIRAQIAKVDGEAANRLSILYGGSVKEDNAQSLLVMPDIDGGLVGGASLQAQAFLGIISCSNLY